MTEKSTLRRRQERAFSDYLDAKSGGVENDILVAAKRLRDMDVNIMDIPAIATIDEEDRRRFRRDVAATIYWRSLTVGVKRTHVVDHIAAIGKVSKRSVWRWLKEHLTPEIKTLLVGIHADAMAKGEAPGPFMDDDGLRYLIYIIERRV